MIFHGWFKILFKLFRGGWLGIKRRGCLHYKSKALLTFKSTSVEKLAHAKVHMFHVLFCCQIEFWNVKHNPNNGWSPAKDAGSADRLTIGSQRWPVFGWRLVFISRADSERHLNPIRMLFACLMANSIWWLSTSPALQDNLINIWRETSFYGVHSDISWRRYIKICRIGLWCTTLYSLSFTLWSCGAYWM